MRAGRCVFTTEPFRRYIAGPAKIGSCHTRAYRNSCKNSRNVIAVRGWEQGGAIFKGRATRGSSGGTRVVDGWVEGMWRYRKKNGAMMN